LRKLLPLPTLAIVGDSGPATASHWDALGRRWWSHIQVLADDRMEGRETGSRGFEKAADYVTNQFRLAGLAPAGVKGYRQPVAFHVTRIDQVHSSLDLVRDGKVYPAKLGEEAGVYVTTQTAEKVEADAVFVGYGLMVPELNYDDLKGQELKGKVVVFVRGGPADMPGPIKAHYNSSDERLKVLRDAGAIGWIGIPNPKVPELPWPRVASGLLLPKMELSDPGYEAPLPLSLHIVFNPERAEMLFAGSGHTFQEVFPLLGSDNPLPRFPLAVRLRARVALTREETVCQNVVGVLPGSDPHLKDEYVVVSAHLDHLGIGEPVNGDPVYSGAMDNASGAASLLEIAHLMRDSGVRPKRSIMFLAVTGEEKGLLGSQYFATHPTVGGPLIANINMDMFLPIYPLKYLEIQGLAESSLGDDVRVVGSQSGVEAHSEYEPDRVLFIRSDQYSFIKVGVPALMCSFGYAPGSAEEKLRKAWSKDRYHGPADDLDQPVDLVGAAQYNSLMKKLVMRVADADQRPAWNSDSFFRRFAQ
jgi:Peptidase family M28